MILSENLSPRSKTPLLLSGSAGFFVSYYTHDGVNTAQEYKTVDYVVDMMYGTPYEKG
jgi:hypothetical protein